MDPEEDEENGEEGEEGEKEPEIILTPEETIAELKKALAEGRMGAKQFEEECVSQATTIGVRTHVARVLLYQPLTNTRRRVCSRSLTLGTRGCGCR